ncbi:phosphoheptose isomerase [Spirochaetia bacterium]|nr:phosphoheptose isomerase [Spirochaetia bacterium]
MDHIQQLIGRYPALSGIRDQIQEACDLIIKTYEAKGKLLIAGNGGSAADSEHIVGELMKSFVRKRALPAGFCAKLEKINSELGGYLSARIQPGLPAIALTGHSSLSSACINDIDGSVTFAQQVYGYGNAGDLFLGISTSGNAKNVLYAALTAKAKDMKVIGLSGNTGGRLAEYADVSIIVPETETFKIQEFHLPIYHALCLAVEEHFFK